MVMKKKFLVRNLSLSIVLGILSSLVACKDSEHPLIANTQAEEVVAAVQVGESASPSEKMYHTMVAEMYRLQGDDVSATMHFAEVLTGNTDEALARVATETAAQTEYTKQAIFSAKQWVSIGGAEVEARQYLALLLLRDEQYTEAAEQLNNIHELITAGEHDGLSFLTSLISLESHKGKAFQAFETYVKLYNDTPSAHLKLADLSFENQDYQGTLQRLKTLGGDELSAEEQSHAKVLESKTLYKVGNYKQAVAAMQQLTEQSGVSDVVRLEFARLLMMNDDEAGAINQLEAIHQNSPENFEVLKSLVAMHIANDQFVQAEKHAQRLMEDPDYQSLAHHFLAEIYESRHDMDAALREYGAVEQGEFYSSAQRRISELLVEQYSLDVAKDWLASQRNVVETADQAFLFWRLEAELLAKYKDYASSVVAYEKAYRIIPGNIQLNYEYAVVTQHLGNVDRAEQLLTGIIQVDLKHADALNALGFMLLEKTDRLTEAAGYIQKAHDLRPNDPSIKDSLGWLYFRQGKVADAAALLLNAYSETEDPEIASHLIEVLLTQGQQQEARELLARMIQQYPEDPSLKSVQKKIIDI
jgi:tetratricopeptide (TPR) repeat protein